MASLLNMSGRGLIGKKKGLLPSGYTQLEYIESTGTQWISTGVDANVPITSLLSATLDFQATSTDNDKWVFGGWNGNDNTNFLIGSYNGQTIGLYGRTFYRTGQSVDTNRHVVRINHIDGSYWDNIKIGNVKYNTNGSTNMLLLFASHKGFQWQYSLPAKIYFCSIMLNDKVVRKFIPCRRDSDNVLGMYDLVNNIFYTNAGTGDFIAGPEV